MSNRAFRFLLSCCFAALQAMAPFIHAHAGAVHRVHTGFLHLHQELVHADAVGHTLASDEHGTEVTVATGLPVRGDTAFALADAPLIAALCTLWPGALMHDRDAGMPAPHTVPRAPPGYTRPPAIAPPDA